jgi:DNA transposition AAA+ family ATPase
MTRVQIIAVAREAVRRVLTNKIGVVPVQERHRLRLRELQQLRRQQEAADRARARARAS